MIQKTIISLRPHFIPLLIILGIAGFQLVRTINAPPVSTVVVRNDTANYLTTLVQHNNPGFFSKDTLFRNPIYMESFWYGSAFLYMTGMDFFLRISGNHIGLAHGYFQVFGLGLYLIGMYLLLAMLLPERWLALALAIVSSFPSSLVGSSSFWGVSRPGPDPGLFIPTTLAVILTTYLGWLIARRWLSYRGEWKQTDSWFAVGIGTMIGVGLYAVHSITCVALIEILTLSGIVQVLRRKIPVMATEAYILGASPVLLFRVANGVGVVRAAISQQGADLAVRLAQNWMIFPWSARIPTNSMFWQISSKDIGGYLTIFFAIYLAVSVASFILIFRDQNRSKLWKRVFITTQAVFFLFAFRMGWAALLVLIYGYRRIANDAEDMLDKNLLIVLVIAQIAGPLQQTALFYIWNMTRVNSLIPLMHEMARFELVAYLPMYVLIGRGIWELTSLFSRRWIRMLVLGVLCILIYLNLDSIAMPLTTDGLWQAILIMIALLFATHSFWHAEFGDQRQTRLSQRTTLALAIILAALAGGVSLLWLGSQHLSSWGMTLLAGAGVAMVAVAFGQASSARGFRLSALLALGLLCAGLVFMRFVPVTTERGASMHLDRALALTLKKRDTRTPPPEPTEDADFLAMADWVKASTPTDSLFHIVSDETSFRYFAERSLLFGHNDYGMMAAEGGIDPVKEDKLSKTLSEYQEGNPTAMTTYLLAHGVNYVVAMHNKPIDLGTVTFQDARYSPSKVYENDSYIIYELVRDP